MRLSLVATVGLIAALTLASCGGERKRYTYKVVSIGDASLLKELNELGAQGWAVASSRRIMDGGTTSSEIILMRERFEGEAAPSEK